MMRLPTTEDIMGKHQGPMFWAEQIRRCRESGKSQKAFCQDTGLARSTFEYWKRKLQKTAGSSHIVAVPVEKMVHASPPLRLHVRGGYLLEVEPGFCQQTLREILEVVND